MSADVLEMSDLKPEMILEGTVRNVVDFGAFVDIGVHQDGLVHISELSDRFVKHPMEVVSVGDIVKVRVLEVVPERKRISLSMKGFLTVITSELAGDILTRTNSPHCTNLQCIIGQATGILIN